MQANLSEMVIAALLVCFRWVRPSVVTARALRRYERSPFFSLFCHHNSEICFRVSWAPTVSWTFCRTLPIGRCDNASGHDYRKTRPVNKQTINKERRYSLVGFRQTLTVSQFVYFSLLRFGNKRTYVHTCTRARSRVHACASSQS